MADFERFRELGVESGFLANLGGLIAGSMGLRKLALDLYADAVERDATDRIFKTNVAVAAERVGEVDRGLRITNALSDKELVGLEIVHPYGYFYYAVILARAKLAGSTLFKAERFAKMASVALSLQQAKDDPDRAKVIETARLA